MLGCFFFLSLKFYTFFKRNIGFWQILIHFVVIVSLTNCLFPFLCFWLLAHKLHTESSLLGFHSFLFALISFFLCPSLFIPSDSLKTVLYGSHLFSINSVLVPLLSFLFYNNFIFPFVFYLPVTVLFSFCYLFQFLV